MNTLHEQPRDAGSRGTLFAVRILQSRSAQHFGRLRPDGPSDTRSAPPVSPARRIYQGPHCSILLLLKSPAATGHHCPRLQGNHSYSKHICCASILIVISRSGFPYYLPYADHIRVADPVVGRQIWNIRVCSVRTVRPFPRVFFPPSDGLPEPSSLPATD